MTKLRGIIRLIVITIRHFILNTLYGMHIHKTARVSYGAKLDKTNPKGIFIGEETYLASGAIVFSHDFSRGIHKDTVVGKRCFIGANAIIMCGVTVGDEVIVGAGSIVTKDVPSNCMVVGNPARIIRTGIHTIKYGRMLEDKVDEND